jgi:hypothetical protein
MLSVRSRFGFADMVTEITMLETHTPNFLRRVLLADAATCAASGIVMSLGAGVLGKLMQIPAGILLYAGLSLFPVAAFIALVATRGGIPVPAVWLVIVGNVLWVLGSLWLLLGGAIAPNALGTVYILAQAAAVALLTVLEIKGVAQVPAAA